MSHMKPRPLSCRHGIDLSPSVTQATPTIPPSSPRPARASTMMLSRPPRPTRSTHTTLLSLTAMALCLAACSSGDPATTAAVETPSSAASATQATAAHPAASAGKPALTVNTLTPHADTWPLALSANGNVAAWQEAVIGSEANGLRITEVRANVGDTVKRGQVLVTMSAATVKADLSATQAALAEANAALAEARANAERARQLQSSGAISAQQINQYLTTESTAVARVEAQRARLEADKLKLSQTQIVAPDDGIISARVATVGSVVGAGQELFRLIRQGRLEWRAELPATDLQRVTVGQVARLQLGDGSTVEGQVRKIAPTVDASTRNGLVYVDLQTNDAVRAGMFARGTLDIGNAPALTLPQTAVALRDGYSYAYRVGTDQRVTQTKISVGRRVGDRVEITAGLKPEDTVVASGVGFLTDGDLVKVVSAPTSPVSRASAATTTATQ